MSIVCLITNDSLQGASQDSATSRGNVVLHLFEGACAFLAQGLFGRPCVPSDQQDHIAAVWP